MRRQLRVDVDGSDLPQFRRPGPAVYRTLEVIGWRYAEPVLQFVTFYTDMC